MEKERKRETFILEKKIINKSLKYSWDARDNYFWSRIYALKVFLK